LPEDKATWFFDRWILCKNSYPDPFLTGTTGLRTSPLVSLPLSDMVTTPVVWCMVVILKIWLLSSHSINGFRHVTDWSTILSRFYAIWPMSPLSINGCRSVTVCTTSLYTTVGVDTPQRLYSHRPTSYPPTFCNRSSTRCKYITTMVFKMVRRRGSRHYQTFNLIVRKSIHPLVKFLYT
jgi:hypothetical protein